MVRNEKRSAYPGKGGYMKVHWPKMQTPKSFLPQSMQHFSNLAFMTLCCYSVRQLPHNFQPLYTYTLFHIHVDDSYKKWVIKFWWEEYDRVTIDVIITKGGRFSLCLLLDSDLHYFLVLLPNLSVFNFFSLKSCSYPSCGFKYCPNADELWLCIFCSNFASEFHVILISSSPEIATWWWTQLLLTKMKVLRLERWLPG